MTIVRVPPPPPPASSATTPERDALNVALDITKWTTGIVGAVLAFCAGLLIEKVRAGSVEYWATVIAIALLAVSFLGGILVSIRVPMKVADKTLEMANDPFFTLPGETHQITGGLGAVIAMIGMVAYAFNVGGPAPTVISASQAIEAAYRDTASGYEDLALQNIQLIAGVTDTRYRADTWWLRFQAYSKKETKTPRPRVVVDVLVGAADGLVAIRQSTVIDSPVARP